MGHYIRGGEGSHWQGCDETHWDCKIMKLEKENLSLSQELSEIKLLVAFLLESINTGNLAVMLRTIQCLKTSIETKVKE